MYKYKRGIATLLLLCMVISLLPPGAPAKAAPADGYMYQLDTDGIDPGATYLIVNTGSTGNANALRFYYQSNCDAGVKNIAFYLKNKKNVKITGDNAHLVFHGRVSPFIFDGCKNITLSGFTLDYEKAFYMQGEVVASTDEYVELKVKEGTYYNKKLKLSKHKYLKRTTEQILLV